MCSDDALPGLDHVLGKAPRWRVLQDPGGEEVGFEVIAALPLQSGPQPHTSQEAKSVRIARKNGEVNVAEFMRLTVKL